MKKLNILAGMLIGLATIFTAASCDDDRDNNPVLPDMPTQNAFVLNTPAYSTANVDLATSDSLRFTWSQPNYGFPAAAQYEMQFSVDNVWTSSVADSLADPTQHTPATYGTVGNPTGTVSAYVGAAALAKTLEQIKHWPEGSVPADLTIYARCQAVYAGDTIYSNVVPVKVLPYYVELKNADPIIYYLIGADIADGKWSNGADKIGISTIPMLPVPGTTFDAATGAGQLEWYGYLVAGDPDTQTHGFKILTSALDWNFGICGDGKADGGTKVRNGGDDPGNIYVAESGYYHITVTTNPDISKATCKIEKMTADPKVFRSISFPGDHNGWDLTNVLTPLETADGNKAYNHDWTTDVTFDADASSLGDNKGLKFAAEGAWDRNWGASDFPYGTGTNNGANIPFKAGSYKLIFNDISGTYYFFAK